jgi:hypothetical protein
MIMKITFFWDLTCYLADIYRRFGETCCLNFQPRKWRQNDSPKRRHASTNQEQRHYRTIHGDLLKCLWDEPGSHTGLQMAMIVSRSHVKENGRDMSEILGKGGTEIKVRDFLLNFQSDFPPLNSVLSGQR